jgi:hypothetical protein
VSAVAASLLGALALLSQDSARSRDVSPDSTYATPGLRALIEATALANRAPPPGLRSYRARLESEVAVVIGLAPQGGSASEHAAPVERVESDVAWQRAGTVQQHVIGYRARTVAASVSALSVLRRPWVVPTPYGDRLHLLFGRDVRPVDGGDDTTVVAVHPLASDREAAYRFAGGEVVNVITTQDGRRIPIVRVLVEPRPAASFGRRTLLFRGEIYLDSVRHQLVRLRGELLTDGGRSTLRGRVLHVGLRTFAFADLLDGEVDGEYWLPTYQRIEAQGRSPIAARFRRSSCPPAGSTSGHETVRCARRQRTRPDPPVTHR